MKVKNSVNGVYGWMVDGVIRYVGSGKDITNSRKSNHLAKLRKGKHIEELQELYDEYGEESFEFVILKKCLVRDLFKWEKYFKDLYQETVFNLNEIVHTKKKKRVGHKSKNHKQKFREMFSGENNPNCSTDTETIIQIKIALKNGMRIKDIALIFGKSDSYISNIKSGYRWANVEIPEDYLLFEITYSNKQTREYEKSQIQY